MNECQTANARVSSGRPPWTSFAGRSRSAPFVVRAKSLRRAKAIAFRAGGQPQGGEVDDSAVGAGDVSVLTDGFRA